MPGTGDFEGLWMALHCSQTLTRAGKRVKHLDGRRRRLSATAAAARSPLANFAGHSA